MLKEHIGSWGKCESIFKKLSYDHFVESYTVKSNQNKKNYNSKLFLVYHMFFFWNKNVFYFYLPNMPKKFSENKSLVNKNIYLLLQYTYGLYSNSN